jgi:hypothetical protein
MLSYTATSYQSRLSHVRLFDFRDKFGESFLFLGFVVKPKRSGPSGAVVHRPVARQELGYIILLALFLDEIVEP